MIPPAMVDEVKRHLSDGKLSQRRIARITGISRATVGAIANGTRPDYPLRAREDDDLFGPPVGPPERCPGCGGRVFLPCRLCHVRHVKSLENERRRRRQWLVDYLHGPAVPKAVVLAERNRAKRRPRAEPQTIQRPSRP